MLRPPLKWAGGKRWLAPRLSAFWRPHSAQRLVEPFVGGMAVALGLRPESALLNDTNKHLINFYRELCKGLLITIAMENNSDAYYAHRRRLNDLIKDETADPAEVASLFYYLNRTGYNGLCRFNSRGEFNVPFGSHKTIEYIRDLHSYSHVLCQWEIVHGDFMNLRLRQDDFIYADPPYDVEFTSYTAGGFSWDDQLRLVAWLDEHSGPIVASNQATQRVLHEYEKRNFHIEIISAPRMISCSGNRSRAREMLATRGL